MTTEENSRFECITMATYDTSGLGASYAALNGTGFSDDIKILKIISESDAGVEISYDGSTDHDYVKAGSSFILDLQANHACNSSYGSGTKGGRKGQIIYGKGSAGTGNLYIIGYR